MSYEVPPPPNVTIAKKKFVFIKFWPHPPFLINVTHFTVFLLQASLTLCYVLPFFLLEFPQKMLRDIRSRLTNLEVSYDFPDTLKSTGGLYWGVSTIFSHFWLNYFYAVGENLKHQNLKNRPKINMLVLRLRSVGWFSRHS